LEANTENEIRRQTIEVSKGRVDQIRFNLGFDDVGRLHMDAELRMPESEENTVNKMNARMKIIAQRKFARISQFVCGCGKPATRMVVFWNEDGDRERYKVCDMHAVGRQDDLWNVDWDASLEVSDIELWKLVVIHQGMTAIRIGSRYEDSTARLLVEEHP
jgi:hypothetical protein